ncbi:YfiR family protein [Vibrio sp. AND4]|uniref:YfiR family protein n=1 Tax=Vibrio sp. AND4 TaxID=314289 RepID=UPI000306ECA0|nr:YfiR family protein [Vibrio sp. AND4]
MHFEKVSVLKYGLALWIFLSTTLAFAHYDDADLKAVYLYRFALLADWVKTSQSISLMEYCVTQSDAVAEHLKRIVARRQQLSGFFDLSRGAEPNTCHILYAPNAETIQIEELKKSFPHSLLIGNGERFVLMGGMVAFVKENNRIRPMVSRSHIAPTGIQLRAQLLSISILAEDEL